MDIISRVKNILVCPKTEWQTIEAENEPHAKVFTTYVVLLAIIPAVAAFIGYGLIVPKGYRVAADFAAAHGISSASSNFLALGLRHAIVQYITMLGSTYLTAFVIDALAENYGAQKNFNRAFALVAYAYTPMFIGGVFYILPSLSWITLLAGAYGLYLLYIGLQPMMKATEEKQTIYFVISLIVTMVVWAVVYAILNAILLNGTYFKF